MFYSVASPDWKPGQPLAPTGALLFRSRAEAESFAPEAPVVTVSVRHDASTRSVVPQGCGSAGVGAWSARAVGNRLGGVTVFGTIPAALIHSRDADAAWNPAASGEAYGWDSLTMALMA